MPLSLNEIKDRALAFSREWEGEKAERAEAQTFAYPVLRSCYNQSDLDEWEVSCMVMFERITFDQKILGGRACIRGMRIPVSVLVGQIAHGASIDEVLSEYPDLETDDVRQALEYAAWLTQEEVHTA